MNSGEKTDPYQIIFGLNRQEDERSLAGLLHQFANPRLTSVLIPRLSDPEINQLVTTLSNLLRTHLSEQEYHTLFLERSR